MMRRLEATIPLMSAEDVPPVEIEIIADERGVQLNIEIDGLCEYRLDVSADLTLHLFRHLDSELLLKRKLLEV